jgi:NTE family protein
LPSKPTPLDHTKPQTFPAVNANEPKTALLLTGGGARAAYQVGILRSLTRSFPGLEFPILTGVSAGAINTALLASIDADFPEAVERLSDHWRSLTLDQVFRTSFRALGSNMVRWLCRVVSGGAHLSPPLRGMVDTAPLREFLHRVLETPDGMLHGINANIRRGRISGVGITTTSYPAGESVTWVQGENVPEWRYPGRRGVTAELTVEHIMASSALPLVFPAARLGGKWHGDGGMRLTSPLSPAVELGAHRIIAISTLLEPGASEADKPQESYPPPATVMGVLLDSIFIDMLDTDAMELRRMNRLLAEHPKSQELGLRPVEVMLIRPSRDIGVIATEFESELPGAFRHLVRGLGSKDTNRSDLLATLLFQPRYISRMMEIGEQDGYERRHEIAAFLGRPVQPAPPPVREAAPAVRPAAKPARMPPSAPPLPA